MKRARAETTGILAAALLLAAGVHCGDASTGDRRIALSASVRGLRSEGVTASGWTVRFERAAVALGPVRMYADDALARARFALGFAFAQHCHGCPRAPLAEFGFRSGGAVYHAVNLLDATGQSLGPGNARNGFYRSAAVSYATGVALVNSGEVATSLAGHSMAVRGTARRDAVTIAFEGTIDLTTQGLSTPSPADDRPYTAFGIAINEAMGGDLGDPAAPASATFGVDPVRVFDQADFATLIESTGGAPRPIAPGGQVETAWRLGMENPRSYRVELR